MNNTTSKSPIMVRLFNEQLFNRGMLDVFNENSPTEPLLTAVDNIENGKPSISTGYRFLPFKDVRDTFGKYDALEKYSLAPIFPHTFYVNNITGRVLPEFRINLAIAARLPKRRAKEKYSAFLVTESHSMIDFWVRASEEYLFDNGVSPTPSRILQLWAYQVFIDNNDISIQSHFATDDHIVNLLKNNVPIYAGFLSLTKIANPDFNDTRKIQYSAKALLELNGLPHTYLDKIIMGVSQ